MYLSQQHGCPGAPACTAETDLRPLANDQEWQLGVQHKGDFVCTGPKYQYPAHSDGDGIHLNVTGYELLGEKTAEIYYQRAVLGQDWQPLAPTGVSRNGRVVTVQFHVPVEPLNWDTTFDAPKITAWANGKGFELFTATSSTVASSSTNITISSVAISGDSVQITASADLPTSGLYVGYALTNQGKQSSNHSKAVRWGQLRDSDPFMGGTTKQANPNYAVSFSHARALNFAARGPAITFGPVGNRGQNDDCTVTGLRRVFALGFAFLATRLLQGDAVERPAPAGPPARAGKHLPRHADGLRHGLHRHLVGPDELRRLRHPLLDGTGLPERVVPVPVRADALQRLLRRVRRDALRELLDDLPVEPGLQQRHLRLELRHRPDAVWFELRRHDHQQHELRRLWNGLRVDRSTAPAAAASPT